MPHSDILIGTLILLYFIRSLFVKILKSTLYFRRNSSIVSRVTAANNTKTVTPANNTNTVTPANNTKAVTITLPSGQRVTTLENGINNSLTKLENIPSPRNTISPTNKIPKGPQEVKKFDVGHRTYNIHVIR